MTMNSPVITFEFLPDGSEVVAHGEPESFHVLVAALARLVEHPPGAISENAGPAVGKKSDQTDSQ
jgi:hypothetical protein